MSDQPQSMFTEAVAAIQTGDKTRARELLSRLLRVDPSNTEYWLWLSTVVPTQRERIFCLKSALKHDPTNRAALRGLLILGARRPEPAELSAAIGVPKRAITKRASPKGAQKQLPYRWILAGAALFTFIGFAFLISLYFSRPRGSAPTLPPINHTETQLALVPTATNTPIPADLRVNRTAIPTELAATPLIYFLESTPSPTPFIGLTPDTRYEAFQSSVRALDEGRYEEALQLIDQVLALNPEFAGAHFVRGEILRLNNQPWEAITAYDHAIGYEPAYAAAFLGSARAQVMTEPDTIPTAFELAIEIDPLLSDAYLYAARFYAERRHFDKVETILLQAVEAGAASPAIMIDLSEAQFLLNKYQSALEYAIQGSADDPGSLKGYLVLGRAFTAVGLYNDALPPLQTYLAYNSEDHRAWSALGTSLLNTGDSESALAAFNTALSMRDYAPAYQGRANIEYQRGDYASALSDYFLARQYGQDSDLLSLSIGKTYFNLGNSREAFKELNALISSTESRAIRAEAYAFEAMLYESTDPPFLSDAITYWLYILDIDEAAPEIRAMAEEHLRNLQGEDYRSPTPKPALTFTPTLEFPVITATSAQPEVTPTPSATPGPTRSPTPKPTATPRGLIP
ncbi:MAG: tetratricopeptide repeat protein [Anaerolineales bacterium]|nr:tetratricopeptide repeat protein [Anaerolineales bacterium]